MSGRKLTCKQLESHLQDVDEFDRPQVRLEQYATPPHIAAQILTTIEDVYGDIRDKLVADLGCGTGRLTIGSIMCAARMVYGFDIDSNALDATLRNISDIFTEDDEQNKTDCIASNAHRYCPNFNLVQVDVTSNHSNDKLWEPWHKMFDTVILNPPFGTKETQGLDLKFVHRAIQISNNSVYSLHKTSTRNHIKRLISAWPLTEAEPIAQIRYNLDNTYKFHKHKSVDIDVDLWRYQVT